MGNRRDGEYDKRTRRSPYRVVNTPASPRCGDSTDFMTHFAAIEKLSVSELNLRIADLQARKEHAGISVSEMELLRACIAALRMREVEQWGSSK